MSEHERKSGQASDAVPQALSRGIHIGIPIASVIVLLAFAFMLFQPANRGALPPTSTTLFVPIYLTIVIVLVFGSMYLFKRLMEAEDPAVPAGH